MSDRIPARPPGPGVVQAVLTVRQPWASAIADGAKTIENRSRKPPARLIGQWIAIHAGLAYESGDAHRLRQCGIYDAPLQGHAPRGVIIAVARVVGWVSITRDRVVHSDTLTERRGAEVVRSEWFMGPVGIVLADVRKLPTPLPMRGALGWQRVPEALQAALDEVAL